MTDMNMAGVWMRLLTAAAPAVARNVGLGCGRLNSPGAREALLQFDDLRIGLAELQAVYRNTKGHAYG